MCMLRITRARALPGVLPLSPSVASPPIMASPACYTSHQTLGHKISDPRSHRNTQNPGQLRPKPIALHYIHIQENGRSGSCDWCPSWVCLHGCHRSRQPSLVPASACLHARIKNCVHVPIASVLTFVYIGNGLGNTLTQEPAYNFQILCIWNCVLLRLCIYCWG